MKKRLISVVSPVYKSEKIVSELARQLVENISKVTDNFEIILVCDGSPDNSWYEIEKCCKSDKRIVGIDLSRNFGQHFALSAGLKYAKGEWVVVMDCDLQDNPAEIPNLYKKAQEGYDIVFAKRKHRKDNFLKKLSSKMFHYCYSKLSGVDSDRDISNFSILNRCVVEEFNRLKDKSRSYYTLLTYLGFERASIEVEHQARYEGKTSYSLKRLLELSLNIMLSNTNKPLILVVKFGFSVVLFSIFMVLYNLLAKFLGIIDLSGFTSTVISIWLIGGLNIFIVGVVGLYIDKIFNQVKDRPLYIVKQILNEDE